MLGIVQNLLLGVASGFLGLLILQAWPPRHRFSPDVSWTVGEPSGQPIYQVKFSRRAYRVWRKRQGPIDVSFRARVAVKGIGYIPSTEHVVAIPCYKDWRPVVGKGVNVKFLAHECDPKDLRYFPGEVIQKRIDGTLTVADLLEIGDAELRIYAFGYRARTGNRWMRRRTYTSADIKPGVFDGTRVVIPEDARPPTRPDLEDLPAPFEALAPDVQATAFAIRVGRWSIEGTRQGPPRR